MRYQERIYIQTASNAVRNKDNVNVNMSSDICIFDKPTFEMVDADKIKTPTYVSDSNINIVTTGDTIPLTFTFLTNIDEFEKITTSFKYKIYKFDKLINEFSRIPKYESNDIIYSSFNGNQINEELDVNVLGIDGEYLIKGSYDFKICTDIMSNLNVNVDTGLPLIGDEYGIYDLEFDYYFAAITKADIPIFNLVPLTTNDVCTLSVQAFSLTGETEIEIVNVFNGQIIVTLNGLTLAPDDDYTVSGQIVTLNGETFVDDILTVAYAAGTNTNGLTSETIMVDDIVVSGITDGEGLNKIYYNTDINKYEIYTLVDPVIFNDLIVTLNGITLANVIDYYQSTVNPRRIILKGAVYGSDDLGDGNIGALADIITITYNSNSTYVGVIQTNTFDLSWTISTPPIDSDGKFTVLFAEEETYDNIIFSSDTNYIANEVSYADVVDLSGYSGTTAFYKIINRKNYKIISGDNISTFTDSETVPIEINI